MRENIFLHVHRWTSRFWCRNILLIMLLTHLFWIFFSVLHPVLEGFFSMKTQTILLLLLLLVISHMAHMNLLPSFSCASCKLIKNMPFSHHIPNDRQHKFFNFIGRNSFFVFFFLFAFQVMHRKLITFWIPSKYWLRISSSFLHFDILDMLLIAKFIHFSSVHYLFEYSNQRNWSTTKNVNYIHELVYRFYFTSPRIGTHMGRDRNREEVSWHFNMCRRVKL